MRSGTTSLPRGYRGYAHIDMRVNYIHSDAVLFLKKNNKFRGANSAILDVKFTSSSMEERWKMIALMLLQNCGTMLLKEVSQVITNLNPVSQVKF